MMQVAQHREHADLHLIVPEIISTSFFEASIGSSFTPFSNLDLSDCDMAVIMTATSGANPPLSTGSTGWSALNTTATDGFFATSRVFYKLNPTADETLLITAGTGAPRWAARLLRLNNASNIAGSGAANLTGDPPSVDIGAELIMLTFAFASCNGTTDYTAGPAGYDGFVYAENTAGNPGIAHASLLTRAQVENPGVFTGGGANRKTEWTAAVW